MGERGFCKVGGDYCCVHAGGNTRAERVIEVTGSRGHWVERSRRGCG